MTNENQANNPPYVPPVDRLLTLGEHVEFTAIDYYGLGIRKNHIPELMRMVADVALHEVDWDVHGDEPPPYLWAPVHAWRALAQMQAVDTAEYLIAHLFWRVDDANDVWIYSEMPTVFQLFGVKAIPPLVEYLNPEHTAYSALPRILAIDCLLAIAEHHEKADLVIGELLYQQLQRHAEHHPEVNAHLAVAVIGLKADSQTLIEEAVEAGHVDTDLMTAHMSGIFDIAQSMFGEDLFMPVDDEEFDNDDLDPRLFPVRAMFPRNNKISDKAKKQKRKQAKQSRKKNRKR